MDKLKAIKIKQASGSYGDSIPIGVDAENVDLTNGKDLETSMAFLDDDTTTGSVDGATALTTDDLVDNVSTAASNKALTANQGYVLNNLITSEVSTRTSEVNNLQSQISTQSANLTSEASTRSTADASLRSAIDALVSPSGQSVVVDSSLSISGAAADAKVTGDDISQLKEDLLQLVYTDSFTVTASTTKSISFDCVAGETIKVTASGSGGVNVAVKDSSGETKESFYVDPNTSKEHIFVNDGVALSCYCTNAVSATFENLSKRMPVVENKVSENTADIADIEEADSLMSTRIDVLDDTFAYHRNLLLTAKYTDGIRYDRNSIKTISGSNFGAYSKIRVKANTEYFFKGIYAYFSTVVYDDGTTAVMSDDTSLSLKATFVAKQDGYAYITISTAVQATRVFSDDICVMNGLYTGSIDFLLKNLNDVSETGNVYDRTKAVIGSWISPENGAIIFNDDFFRTPYIDVSGFTHTGYVTSGEYNGNNFYVAYFKSDYTFISGETLNHYTDGIKYYNGGQLSIPSDCKYLVVSAKKAFANVLQVIDSDSHVPFDPYGYHIDIPISELVHEYHVDKSGGYDYTSLTECLNHVRENGEKAIVYLHEGTYNVIDEGAITDYTTQGLEVPHNTKLIGAGNKDNIIITMNGSQSGTSYTQAQKTLMSPLNIFGVDCLVKGITIIGQNCRYCVHQDSAIRTDGYHIVMEDCVMKYLGNDFESSWGGGVYAAGCRSGGNITLRNCDMYYLDDAVEIESAIFGMHTNTDFEKPANIVLENCRMYGSVPEKMITSLRSLASGVTNHAEFIGCESNVPLKLRISDSAPFDFNVTGYGNGHFPISNATSENPIVKFSDETILIKNGTTSAITKGTPVKMTSIGNISPLLSSDNIKLLYGVALEDISASDKGYVKTCGYVLASDVIWSDKTEIGNIVGDYILMR